MCVCDTSDANFMCGAILYLCVLCYNITKVFTEQASVLPASYQRLTSVLPASINAHIMEQRMQRYRIAQHAKLRNYPVYLSTVCVSVCLSLLVCVCVCMPGTVHT